MSLDELLKWFFSRLKSIL